MAIYDISLRIGASKGIYPKFIYLHAGALEGAKNLGIDVTGKKYLEIKDLEVEYLKVKGIPSKLTKMKAADIENFLCTNKDDFNGAPSKNASRSCASASNKKGGHGCGS